MEKINLESWDRRTQYEFFANRSEPFYSVTFPVEVTKLYEFTKPRGLSFYYGLIWLVTQAVNCVPTLLCGTQKGELVRYDRRRPSFTDMKKGTESFYIVTMSCEGTLEDFCRAAAEKSAAQTGFIDPDEETGDLIYISCLPWMEITSLTNEHDFDHDDAVPRIAWGKYRDEGGRKTLGMSVELNHRFADGVHIGRFAQALAQLQEKL